VSSSIDYQGQLTDGSGNPLSGTYNMTFKLYDASSGGTALATDMHSVTVTDGLFSTTLNLGTSSFDGRALWLGIKVGTDPEMTPRQELRPVPYALSLVPGARIVGDTPDGLRIETEGDHAIYGEATNSGDVRNYGGFFVADGSQGRGVYGKALNPADEVNYGGFFYASGTEGRGVFGQANGSSGIGVKGWASDEGNVYNYGGHFLASGIHGRGVHAEATGTAGLGIYARGYDGVEGVATGSYGYGVHGVSPNGTGVYAESYDGRGVYGYSREWYGVSGDSRNNNGVNGYSWDSAGVKGFSENNIGVLGDGKTYDFYAFGPGTNYGPFTGAHEVKLSADFPENVTPGMIVSVNGETQVRQIDGRNISFSSTLPSVQLSDTPNDSRVLGVLISESPLPKGHWYINESIEGDRFGSVNALGEGRVWVTDINGDIGAGDYITTSLVAGYGQKQGDTVLHSYTLGKAIESPKWSKVTTTVEFNGQTYKAYPIAVVYTSG
jgi:hypothetical protein